MARWSAPHSPHSSHRGREGRVLAALLALNQDVLGAPPVDLAHGYVLNLVVHVEALNHLRHRLLLSLSPSSSGSGMRENSKGSTSLCLSPVILALHLGLTPLD